MIERTSGSQKTGVPGARPETSPATSSTSPSTFMPGTKGAGGSGGGLADAMTEAMVGETKQAVTRTVTAPGRKTGSATSSMIKGRS